MQSKEFYIDIIRREADTFAATIEQGINAPVSKVPSCPGWNTLQILLHVGSNYEQLAHSIDVSKGNAPEGSNFKDYLGLEEPYKGYLAADKAPDEEKVTPELVAWFRGKADRLVQLLSDTNPETPVASWGGKRPLEGLLRMMAFETSLHRWDAQNAYGNAQPLLPEAAREGMNFAVSMFPLRRMIHKQEPPAHGETYIFETTDSGQRWLVEFAPDSAKVTPEPPQEATAGLTIRGTASDLMVFQAERARPAGLQFIGDKKLVDRFFELLPPI
jgi:uncharacterized protein (TIGR03083 family)